jgi:hypothetical protein
MKKGIVISPKFQPLPNGIKFDGDIDASDLRKYLLYWDEIVLAENNIVVIRSNDFNYLVSAGVAKKERIIFTGSFKIDSGLMIVSQQAAWAQREQAEPGVWSIAQSSYLPYFVDGVNKSVIEFELYNVPPIPSEDVPLNDILEFKQRRKDELLAFRVHLDELYQSVLSAENTQSAKNAALIKINIALSAINKTLEESNIRKGISSLRSTIQSDFSGIIGTALAAGTISNFLQMTPVVAGLAGGGFYLAVKTLIAPNVIAQNKPFNYIKSSIKEIR